MSIVDKATAEQQLFWLLQSMFQPSELRRFLRHRADYAMLHDQLPGEEASPNRVTGAVIQALDGYGLITRRLFDALIEERPYRRDDVERVAATWDLLADHKDALSDRGLRAPISSGIDAQATGRELSMESKHASHLTPDLQGGDTLGMPSGPLKFSSISIDTGDPNWREITKGSKEIAPVHSPFNRPCSQRFSLLTRAHSAQPLFDITLLNARKTPVILTAIGTQIITVCDQSEMGSRSRSGDRGIPQAVKIPKRNSHTIQIPDIKGRIFERLKLILDKGEQAIEHELQDFLSSLKTPQDIQETIVKKLPDPIYLESKAPYRYGLILMDYHRNIPSWARIRMWLATDQGECWSSELETYTF